MTLKFRDKPVIPIKDGFSFFFNEKDGIEYWLNLIVELNQEKTTQWVKLKPEKDPEYLGRKYTTDRGLETPHRTRDQHLINIAEKFEIAVKDEVNLFFDELGPYIQNNIIYPSPGEDQEGEDPEDKHPESFQDYPENIRKGALEIIEDPEIDIILFFETTLSKAHEGDTLEIEFNILKEFSPHVEDGEPVHELIKGGTDSGKTDLTKEILNIVPTRWQLDLTSVSSKYLYYSKTLREDYNHIVINDVLDNPDILALIKVLSDNLQERKKHKTVIDKEAVDMEIPGKNTLTITAKKDINDPETERRFLHLNPQEDPEHKEKVKDFIKKMGITGPGDTTLYFELCQAIFDKLTENPVKVFNPWIYGLNVDDLGFTDIKIFIGLVKARSLIYRDNRKSIGDNIILGSREDVENVLRLWYKIAPLQQYKLTKKQLELLKELPLYDEDIYRTSLKEMKEEGNYTLEGTTGKTFKELSSIFKTPPQTIRTWIKGIYNKNTGQEKPGLESLGFIITKSSDPDKEKASILCYLNPKKKEYVEDLKGGKTYLDNVENKIKDSLRGLNSKNKVIELYLTYVNKYKMYIEDIQTNPLFEKLPSTLKTDEDVYKLICLTKEVIKDLKISEVDPVDNILLSLRNEKNKDTPKTEEGTLNNEGTPGTIINNKINIDNIDKNGKERTSTNNPIDYYEDDQKIEGLDPEDKDQVEKDLINITKENPGKYDFDILGRKVTSLNGIDEPLVKEVLYNLIRDGILKDGGDGTLEPVEGIT